MSRSDVLVSTDWAQSNLDTQSVVFVEVDEDTSAYDTGHIPGAINLPDSQFDKLAFRMKMAMERRRAAAPTPPATLGEQIQHVVEQLKQAVRPDKSAQDQPPPAEDSPQKTRPARRRRAGFVRNW